LERAEDTFSAQDGDPPFTIITSLKAKPTAPDARLIVKVVAQDNADIQGILEQDIRLEVGS
jgi:hypothetical protein